jgi:hypothetical protein
VDEAAVAQTVGACGGADANDPQTTEVDAALTAVRVRILPRMVNLLDGITILAAA